MRSNRSFGPAIHLGIGLRYVKRLVEDTQQRLYQRALRFREEHPFEAKNYDELKERVEQGFVRSGCAVSREDEEKIQQDTKATIHAIPIDPAEGKVR